MLGVSTPMALMSRSRTRNSAASLREAGEVQVGGVAGNVGAEVALGSGQRVPQPLYITTIAPRGMRPFALSQARRSATRQTVVGVLRRLRAHVDAHQRTDAGRHRHLIGRRAAAREMHRRVHVRAAVLGGADSCSPRTSSRPTSPLDTDVEREVLAVGQ